MDSFNRLLWLQGTHVKNATKFENELKIMQQVLAPENVPFLDETRIEWFQSLQSNMRDANCNGSIRKREKGNAFFEGKGEQQNFLEAARYYTAAIFDAPDRSEPLARAYANRGMALQKFGYYQQAYDDAECALETGVYPLNMRSKLWLRQAHCAWKLENAELLRTHLDALKDKSLSGKTAADVEELEEAYNKLLEEEAQAGKKSKEQQPNIQLNRDGQRIVRSDSTGERSMMATKAIQKNDFIFCDRATSFVPVQSRPICQNCSAVHLIPFPCTTCHGEVVYCSLRCKLDHTSIHQVECPGYRHKLFDNVGVSHLAMRLVIEGLPKLMPFLRSKRKAVEIWEELTGEQGFVANHQEIDYAQSLYLITHLRAMRLPDIVRFALASGVMMYYLKDCTSFFEFSDDAMHEDWRLVVGALILRHTGQIIVNGHTSSALVLTPIEKTEGMPEFDLLVSEIWVGPYLLKRGHLHKYVTATPIAAMDYPYLSLCNHDCEQSFVPKFSGRYMSAYAVRDFEPGDEITNCYTDLKYVSMSSTRRNNLKSYHFDCKCSNCKSKNPDEDYFKMHRYHCLRCRQNFIFKSPSGDELDWWRSPDDGAFQIEDICCSNCGAKQNTDLYQKIFDLLFCTDNSQLRSQLFELFHCTHKTLLDYHQLKMELAFCIVQRCIESHFAGALLKENEFCSLVEIYQFHLRGVELYHRVNSMEFARKMTYMWDFIALKKYNCKRSEMEPMLQALQILSDDNKLIFTTYYKSYIEPLLK